jgi:chorismate mutase/prephenate dehydrogenase
MSDRRDTPETDLMSALRERIDDLDKEILATAAERMTVVNQIHRLKLNQGRSVFDRTREKAVVERALERGEALDLDPELTRGLVQTLIEGSHRLQERQTAEFRDKSEGKHLLIIGGDGQMGRRFGEAFEARGHTIAVHEQRDGKLEPALVEKADVVMIAVPMERAVKVAMAAAPLVRPDALLCDINSLKADICTVFEQSCRGQALGTHPMFGPTVKSFRRQKVIVCPIRPGPLVQWFQEELGRMGCDLIEIDPHTHDHMMAVIQVLVHFRTLVMGEALRRSGIEIASSLRLTSPIYRLELAFVGRLFTQDPALYAEIEMSNPYGRSVRSHFLDAARHMETIINDGNREDFDEAFRNVADYFSAFSEEAMTLSDLLIEKLVQMP